MKHVAILGSTGSIGTQTLEVIEQHPDKFKVVALSARSNADLLIQQAIRFRPGYVVITNGNYDYVKKALKPYNIEVLDGSDNLLTIAALPMVDIVVTALVGFAGLLPTIHAIKNGKDIALANKETLVVAGEIVTDLAKKNNVKILPVDSEHSAIFQCLIGEDHSWVEKIFLTASGGPFRGMTTQQLKDIKKEQALKHPNWSMGSKITIDSATLMNKGLEAIEARWLFDLAPDQIDIIVHPQSIIHSLVQFVDGSIKAQMGLPDMRLPIQIALSYPERIPSSFPRFDFASYPELTFEKPDTEVFRCLALALDALHTGGNMPCVLNAANEIAVDAFLHGSIGFLEIAEIVEETLNKMEFISHPTLEQYLECDRVTREFSRSLIVKKS